MCTQWPDTRPGRRDHNRAGIWIVAFLVPTLVLYGTYTLYPTIASIWYSFLDWNGFDESGSFNGLQNYQDLFADPLFWNSFRVTALFILASVPLQIVASLLVAILLNSPNMPFSGLFRTALFLPVVTTSAIVGVVMQFVFDPSAGPINELLRQLGMIDGGIAFLGRADTSLWTIVAVYVWKWFGITLVYWLAVLQTIPKELYEAARTDGAGAIRIVRHITWPLLTRFAIVITLLTVEAALHVFDLVLTMTNGGPYYATEVLEIFVYRWAFDAPVPRLGYASAAAVLFGLFVCVIAVLQLIGTRRTAARNRGM